MTIELPYRDAPNGTLRVNVDAIRVIAECGGAYLVALDGRPEELAPSVVYSPRSRGGSGRLSHVAVAGGHLKMWNGYSSPFTGSAAARETIEADVRELLAAQPHLP